MSDSKGGQRGFYVLKLGGTEKEKGAHGEANDFLENTWEIQFVTLSGCGAISQG